MKFCIWYDSYAAMWCAKFIAIWWQICVKHSLLGKWGYCYVSFKWITAFANVPESLISPLAQEKLWFSMRVVTYVY